MTPCRSLALILFFAVPPSSGAAPPPLAAQSDEGDSFSRRAVELSKGQRKLKRVEDQRVVLDGDARLVLFDSEWPVGSGVLMELESLDSSLLFTKLSLLEVQEKVVGHPDLELFVMGERARQGKNLRLVRTSSGTLLLPDALDREVLVTYTRRRMGGEARGFPVHAIHGAEALGEDNDEIASFVLKPWSMVTLAENGDGTGASQVFLAGDEPLEVASLPKELRGKVSFLRALPWSSPTKKGFAGAGSGPRALNATWFYDWTSGRRSEPGLEYVPMQKGRFSGPLRHIQEMRGVTHLLGFNEPMQKDQANMSLEDCLDLWPMLQGTGLRLGSPSPTDGTLGWLYRFMDQAEARGLRVDFCSIHFYKGGWSAQQTMAWLNAIHRRVGRPLWVTEFNNGASWVKNHDPSLEDNAEAIDELCQAMDDADFIERYSVFDLGHPGHHRQIFLKGGGLSPAGQLYRDRPSTLAIDL